MSITKQTKRRIEHLEWQVREQAGRVESRDTEIARLNQTIADMRREQAEFTSQVADKIADAERYKQQEDQRFNGVLQATLQTAISTALGRRQ